MMITNSANLTKNLTHTHPISFTYDTNLCGLDQMALQSRHNLCDPARERRRRICA